MKLFVVCLFAFLALSLADEETVHSDSYSKAELLRSYVPTPTSSRGCRYIMGRCVEDCPEGTHAYTTGCSPRMPEATCEEPNPVQEKYALCDYSSCYCDPGTVRDTESKKCVKPEDCPKKEEPKKEEPKKEEPKKE